jgi:hypothetical protein
VRVLSAAAGFYRPRAGFPGTGIPLAGNPLTNDERSSLIGWVTHTDGSPIVVTPLSTYDIRELGGFVAVDIDEIVGVLAYAIEQSRIIDADHLPWRPAAR